jgi:hypothetical protein
VDAEGNVNLQGGDVPEAEGLNFAEGAGAQEDPTAFEEFVKTSLPRLGEGSAEVLESIFCVLTDPRSPLCFSQTYLIRLCLTCEWC